MNRSTSTRKLLIVAATLPELEPLISKLGNGKPLKYQVTRYVFRRFQIDVLITGVGMVPTAVYTSMVLGKYAYDAVINAGICGSFSTEIPIGTVVNVTSDCLPETGAEDGEQFHSLFDLKLMKKNDFPFIDGKLINDSVFNSELIAALPQTSGVTVNTVHGNAQTIAAFIKHFPVAIESMEGAAFMFSCIAFRMRYLQIRSVSNFIEERNIARWDVPLAILNLNQFLLDLLNE